MFFSSSTMRTVGCICGLLGAADLTRLGPRKAILFGPDSVASLHCKFPARAKVFDTAERFLDRTQTKPALRRIHAPNYYCSRFRGRVGRFDGLPPRLSQVRQRRSV